MALPIQPSGGLADPTDSHHDPGQNPWLALWRAVVAQAWTDAFGQRRSNGAADERDQARAWLIREDGQFADDRKTVCNLADIDPDFLRMLALTRIDLERSQAVAAVKRARSIDQALARLINAEEVGVCEQELDELIEFVADKLEAHAQDKH